MDKIFEYNELDPNAPPPEPELSPEILAQVTRGANWFYWIAGLSLVNSAIFAFGGDITFILGLAFTQIIDVIVDVSVDQGAPGAIRAVAIVLDLVLVGVFALFGYYAGKAINAVFIIGIVIYVVDGLTWVFLGSYFAAAFHAYVLFMLIRGFMASREVSQFNARAKVGAFGR